MAAMFWKCTFLCHDLIMTNVAAMSLSVCFLAWQLHVTMIWAKLTLHTSPLVVQMEEPFWHCFFTTFVSLIRLTPAYQYAENQLSTKWVEKLDSFLKHSELIYNTSTDTWNHMILRCVCDCDTRVNFHHSSYPPYGTCTMTCCFYDRAHVAPHARAFKLHQRKTKPFAFWGTFKCGNGIKRL